MINFETSLQRAKNGNPKIDTPQAASDLYYILHKKFKIKLDSGIIELRKVDYGSIEFRVKAVLFKFMYKPTHSFRLFYMHLESDKWQDAHYDDAKSAEHLIKTIQELAFKKVPTPFIR